MTWQEARTELLRLIEKSSGSIEVMELADEYAVSLAAEVTFHYGIADGPIHDECPDCRRMVTLIDEVAAQE